jgi:uncharacterized protein YkwD
VRRALVSLCVLSVALAAGRGGADDKKPDEPKLKLTDAEQKILDLTNKERAREKLPELKLNEALVKAARAHSENMAKQGKFDHFLDGQSPLDRARAAGYKGAVGENIMKGDESDPAVIVAGWMDSKLHRENILRKEFAEIGVGIVKTADGVYYYTQVFGIPRN